ncbi:MAG: hypothetical protein ABI703_11540 [Gemmatimonadales bacterium]
MNPPSIPLSVIKIGGGLAAVPGALDQVCGVVSAVGCDYRILVVPGGGTFADTVRSFDRTLGLSPDAAHWMAILAMDQYAHALAERIRGARLIDEPGALPAAGVSVLAPYRWMRAADILPHDWEVTSDSIAAFVAGALDAVRLILIKPASGIPEPVDSHFRRTLPAGLPCFTIGWDRMDELAACLSG